jgi:hypothetical protein
VAVAACTHRQAQGNDSVSPPLFIGLTGPGSRGVQGDRFYVTNGYWNSGMGALDNANIVFTDLYIGPSDITRNAWHTVEAEMLWNNAGSGY